MLRNCLKSAKKGPRSSYTRIPAQSANSAAITNKEIVNKALQGRRTTRKRLWAKQTANRGNGQATGEQIGYGRYVMCYSVAMPPHNTSYMHPLVCALKSSKQSGSGTTRPPHTEVTLDGEQRRLKRYKVPYHIVLQGLFFIFSRTRRICLVDGKLGHGGDRCSALSETFGEKRGPDPATQESHNSPHNIRLFMYCTPWN